MIFTGLYSNVENRFNDWVQQSGRQITNLALDYINRALVSLWQEDDWEYATKRATLTVSSNVATLPTDFGKILAIYYDSDGDNKPDNYYWKDGVGGKGYQINPVFSKSTGFTFTITFLHDITQTPIIYYKYNLTPFTGSGIEYTFFPENLLLLKAQLICSIESGGTISEYEILEKECQKETNRLRRDVQNVNSMQQPPGIRDDYGNTVILPSMDLTGAESFIPTDSRSRDIRE